MSLTTFLNGVKDSSAHDIALGKFILAYGKRREDLKLLTEMLEVAVEALNREASWDEGKYISPSFDSPAGAANARDALKQLERMAAKHE